MGAGTGVQPSEAPGSRDALGATTLPYEAGGAGSSVAAAEEEVEAAPLGGSGVKTGPPVEMETSQAVVWMMVQ